MTRGAGGTKPPDAGLRSEELPTEPRRSRASRSGRRTLVATVLVTLLGVGISTVGALAWNTRNVAQTRAQFAQMAEDSSAQLANELLRYGDLVSASAALFHQGVVTRADYASYLQAVGFGSSSFAGVLGIGLVQLVEPAQVPGFLASLRADGIPVHSVLPAGTRSSYCLGSYAGWRNLKVTIPLYGYDFCTLPAMSALLSRATRTGQQQVLGGFAIAASYGSDFLLAQPVYVRQTTPAAPRRQAMGWVIAIINGQRFWPCQRYGVSTFASTAGLLPIAPRSCSARPGPPPYRTDRYRTT